LKISLITATYNSAATVQDTLRSVAMQTYLNVEHIIIDGASKDRTLEIVREHGSHVAKIVSERDNGIYDAMNKGIAMATGDVIGLINSDDFFASETVLEQVAEAFKNPEIEACYADLDYVDQETASKVIRRWKSSPFRPGLFARGWCPAHPTFYVKRSVYERLGGAFDLTYRRAADVVLMMKLLEVERIKTVYVPQTWVKMRVGGATDTKVSNVIKQNQEILHGAKGLGVKINPVTFTAHKFWSRFHQYRNA